MYADENGSGKRPGSLLGEIVTDFLGATLPNPLVASAFRVISRRAAAASSPVPAAPTRTAAQVLRSWRVRPPTPRSPPSINVVTLPNGTAVPQVAIPSSNGGAPAPAWTPPQDYGAGAAGTQGSGGGSTFGPPPDYPVEVGTLSEGDSTGGSPFSLAGITPNSPLLLLAAVAAFFLLGDNKKKRRR